MTKRPVSAAASATRKPAPAKFESRAATLGNAEKRTPAGSQTVDRALGLIQLVAASPAPGLRLSDLAETSELDRATAYRLLVSLTNRGFLEQDEETKRYTLGLEFFTLAASASNYIDLGEVARETLRSLASETGDTATFCVRSGLNLICMDVETGSFPIRTLPMDIGSHRPLGAGASGIAMLSALPDFEIKALLQKSAKRLQEVPGQDEASILAAIAETRAHGFALAAEEPLGRIMGLAVALLNRRGRPQCTLTLNGIPERFAADRLAELATMVTGAARAIEEAMRRMPDTARHRTRWMKEAPAKPRTRRATAGKVIKP